MADPPPPPSDQPGETPAGPPPGTGLPLPPSGPAPFTPPGASPPPPPGTPPPYGAPGYGAPPGYGPPGYGAPSYGYGYAPLPTSKTNPLAIASLVLAGIGVLLMITCFIGWIAWIVGLVLGLVALSQIKGSADPQAGRGLAVGGVAANGALLALSILGFIIFVVFLATADVDDDFDDFEEICSGDIDGDGLDDCEDSDGFSSTTTFSIPG